MKKASNPWLNIWLIQGYQSYLGYQGYQGFQGYQGYQGFQVYQGYQGYQGYEGYEGACRVPTGTRRPSRKRLTPVCQTEPPGGLPRGG